jgi:hypothetical protein
VSDLLAPGDTHEFTTSPRPELENFWIKPEIPPWLASMDIKALMSMLCFPDPPTFDCPVKLSRIPMIPPSDM